MFALLVALLLAPETIPTNLRAEVAFPKLSFQRPLYVHHPGDGTDRLFVLEQDGRVLVFDNKRDIDVRHVALDIKERVYRGHNEEGLLGMAFHPKFETNRKVYLHYSMRSPRRGRVSEFRMDAKRETILQKTERVILEQRQPWGNHNGGCLEFGPDGYLYLSFGDGGAGGDPHDNGQNLGTWLGTILRVDVDRQRPYAIPKGNPFRRRNGAKREIWAYGLRNVWRFSFDRETGDLWAGDVGQNQWEEIDLIVKGGNYGWRVREGSHLFRRQRFKGKLIDPVVEHHAGEARSITGGYVYRGKRLPGLVGAYVYADYVTHNVWALRWDGRKVVAHKRICSGRFVASFGEDRDGEIHLACFDGRIYTLAEME